AGNRALGPIEGSYFGVPLSVIRLQQGIGNPHNLVTGDIYLQIIPWRAALGAALRRGEWPLWNPFMLCGDILAAAAQPAPYSPFVLLSMLVSPAVSITYTAA